MPTNSARALSPRYPSAGAVEAARLLLREVREAIRNGDTFGLESTISGVTYVRLLRDAQHRGYALKLFYLWLPSAEAAVRLRAAERVRNGGHDVPAADVRRRFERSLRNLHLKYLPLAWEWRTWRTAESCRVWLRMERLAE